MRKHECIRYPLPCESPWCICPPKQIKTYTTVDEFGRTKEAPSPENPNAVFVRKEIHK